MKDVCNVIMIKFVDHMETSVAASKPVSNTEHRIMGKVLFGGCGPDGGTLIPR